MTLLDKPGSGTLPSNRSGQELLLNCPLKFATMSLGGHFSPDRTTKHTKHTNDSNLVTRLSRFPSCLCISCFLSCFEKKLGIKSAFVYFAYFVVRNPG